MMLMNLPTRSTGGPQVGCGVGFGSVIAGRTGCAAT